MCGGAVYFLWAVSFRAGRRKGNEPVLRGPFPTLSDGLFTALGRVPTIAFEYAEKASGTARPCDGPLCTNGRTTAETRVGIL